MAIQSWSSRYSRFVIHHRVFVCALIVGIMLGGGWVARRATLAAKITDYYPSFHPHVRLYQEFPEMLKLTNAVVVTVTVKEGTIYTNETLGKIHRISVALLDTKGVNPFEVMSLTTPRLKDIRIQDGSINVMPVVEGPEHPQSPEVLTRIKNAVYTNLGIRGVYVSPDDKTALIRAGFWDGMVDPQVVFARLRTLIARERDANTEVEVSGNLVLAAWLIEAAPRVLLLLLMSGAVVFLFAGYLGGALSGAVLALVVNLLGAVCGFGLLGVQRLALDPFSLLVMFPLVVRGVAVALQWSFRLTRVYLQEATPFAAQEGRFQVLAHTGALLWRPLTVALCVDAGAFLGVFWVSDVPALRTLSLFATGWIAGILVALWTVLPLWAVSVHPHRSGEQRWGNRIAVRFIDGLWVVCRPVLASPLGWTIVGVLGVFAALQLEAGREMMGTTLFYPSHPYTRALTRVNENFIGVNQLIVIAQTAENTSFRDPRALLALETFQHYMGEDEHLGGSFAITNLVKSVTRMFHEDIPKWEVVPNDLESAGQVVFRIVSSAATPTEIARLLSTDFRTTAVSLFYHRYSPQTVERALHRARTFNNTAHDGQPFIEFRLGGGLLGITAAVHAAVERDYWSFLGLLALLAIIGAGLCGVHGREMLGIGGLLIATQLVVFLVLWSGGKGIDLNIYTLPIIMVGTGMALIPAFACWLPDEELFKQTFAITGLIIAAGAAVWLFSPMRLQGEMGIFFIVLAVIVPLLARQVRMLGRAD